MQQKNLILALIISSAILFGWSYFYPVKSPQSPSNSNAAPSPAATAPIAPSNSAGTSTAQSTPQSAAVATHSDPRRSLKIHTPLYETTFDTQGAEPISWIILK